MAFDPAAGYPAGASIEYECTRCGATVPSQPANADACSCRNIVVDGDAGRVSVQDHAAMRVYRIART